jgi:putative endonuclease
MGSPPSRRPLVERSNCITSTFSPVAATALSGVTNNLGERLAEHRDGKGSKFVKQYGVLRLVYVESFERADEAIAREKQLKKWNRDWKIRLIETDNPEWRDLSDLIT